jgi:hypothetical protein
VPPASENPALVTAQLTGVLRGFDWVKWEGAKASDGKKPWWELGFVHDPNLIGVSFSIEPKTKGANPKLAALTSVNVFNLLFRRHDQDFVELALQVQGAYDRVSDKFSTQIGGQYELHLDDHISIVMSVSWTHVYDGGKGFFDYTFGPYSIGLLYHCK